MHRHGAYYNSLPRVSTGTFSNLDKILVDNIEEPIVIAGCQLLVTGNQVEVLITRIYAEPSAMALDHSDKVKPHKGLTDEVTTTVHLTSRRYHKPKPGKVSSLIRRKACVTTPDNLNSVLNSKSLV